MISIYLTLIDDESDKIKFQEIYDEYKKQMWYTANEVLHDSFLAEDAVHDAFLGIARNFSKIRSFEPNTIRAYVITSARNSALMIARKNKFGNTVDIDSLNNIKDTKADDRINEIDTLDFAVSVIRRMPALYSEVMYLRFVLELSEKEIALSLGRNVNTVRQQISRGRKMFIDIMSQGDSAHDK
ncbi:MAG: RNA polymerase sigma factor [Acutalibacteraceae bacterium]